MENTVENTGKIMTSVNTGDKITGYIQGTEFIFHSKTLSIAPSFPNLYFCAAVNHTQLCENTEAFLLHKLFFYWIIVNVCFQSKYKINLKVWHMFGILPNCKGKKIDLEK